LAAAQHQAHQFWSAKRLFHLIISGQDLRGTSSFSSSETNSIVVENKSAVPV
jgi:hypothetical protein